MSEDHLNNGTPRRSKRLRSDLVFWSEVVGTVGVGALLFFAVHARDLGQIVWIVGGLLIYFRYSLEYSFRTEARFLATSLDEISRRVDRIGDYISLHATAEDAAHLRGVVDKYFQVTEDELAWHRDHVVRTAEDELRDLVNLKRSPTMLTGEYYRWLLPRLHSAPAGSEIWAISRMMDCEWDDSPEEAEFLRANIEAADRGVHVSRLFICARDVWEQARGTVEPVRRQIECGGNLSVYFGDKDAIERRDASILGLIGDGLVAIDRRVVLVDEHSSDGTARGFVSANPSLIAAYRDRFEILRNLCVKAN